VKDDDNTPLVIVGKLACLICHRNWVFYSFQETNAIWKSKDWWPQQQEQNMPDQLVPLSSRQVPRQDTMSTWSSLVTNPSLCIPSTQLIPNLQGLQRPLCWVAMILTHPHHPPPKGGVFSAKVYSNGFLITNNLFVKGYSCMLINWWCSSCFFLLPLIIPEWRYTYLIK